MGREAGGDSAERPAHTVRLDYDFFLAKYEVPQNLWTAVMGSNPSRWQGPRNSVEQVTYEQAQQFCQQVTRLLRDATIISSQQIVRLPSEAEWEYCARAGTVSVFSFGDDPGDIDDYAWHKGNAKGNDPPVGVKKPNPWGFYDVHGYLWEWCADPWHPNYTGAPGDGSVWMRGGQMNRRVIRGGSWKNAARQLSSSFRQSASPDIRDDAIGLRCVLTSD